MRRLSLRPHLQVKLPVRVLMAATVLSVFGAVGTTPASSSTLPTGIAGLGGTARTALPSTVSSYARTATALGPASPASAARVLISLQHRDQSGLLRFIAAVSNPRSPLYEHYLTPGQFTARYAPSQATVGDVEGFVHSYGLYVASVPSNRAYVYATGTVGEMERAFRTTIERYSLGGQTIEAPTREASVPARFAGVITAVEGLDTGDVARPMSAVETPPAPAYVNAPPQSLYWGQKLATQAPGAYGQKVLPDVVHGYTPQQLEGAYGVNGVIANGLNGRGQTVAVIDAYSSPTITQDADQWSSEYGLPMPKLTLEDNAAERDQPEGPAVPSDVPDLGGANLQDPQGWFGEETLDVEAVHAMAPGANIVVQSALSDLNLDLHMAQNNVVSKGLAQIISNSYGGSSDSQDTTSDGYWQQAAAQGIGVYFSSGDSGDQTDGGTDTSARSVDEDPNSPYVTAVGGTTLAVGARDNYEFETYWGTDTATLTGGAWGPNSFEAGGGGGTSEVYGEPSYQTKAVPARFADYWKGNSNAVSGATIPGRVVPDVAMDADASTGLLIGETEDFSAYSNPDGYDLPTDAIQYGQYRLGGTSLSSPLFAGLMALADQAAGRPHGFANPALYAMYRTRAFHDVTAPRTKVAVVRTNYVNNTNASGGTETLLRTAGDTATLSSIPGFDDSTGLGSPDGVAFLSGLAPGSRVLKAAVQ